MAERAAKLTQADTVRTIKAALAAGLIVSEIVATKDGVRIITGNGEAGAPAANKWDRVLGDAATK